MALSRGALIALIAGLFVIAVIRPRRATAAAYVTGLGGLVVSIAALAAFPAVRSVKQPHADLVSQGKPMTAIAVAAALVAGALFYVALGRRPGWDHQGWRPSFKAASRLAVVGLLLFVVGTVGVSYLSEQTENVAGSTQRLSEVKTYRGPYWRVALDTFAHHPLIGVGTASYQVEWRRERTAPKFTFNAHSIYFETLAELGIVGGLLLLGMWGSVGWGLLRLGRLAPLDPVLPAAAAVCSAFALHVAVDWDWEMPAATLPALLLAAAALAPIDSRS
jgi:O-antigen ligase